MNISDERVSLELANCSVRNWGVWQVTAPIEDLDPIIECVIKCVEPPGV